jgi:hypothetical protein
MLVNKHIAKELDTLLTICQDMVEDIKNRSRSGYGNNTSEWIEDAVFEISGLSNGFHSSMAEGIQALQELMNGSPRMGKWIMRNLKKVGNRIDLPQLIQSETSKKSGVAEAGHSDANRLEHRGAEYNVYFNTGKGMYTARGTGQMKGQIAPQWFRTLDDAQEHAETEIGSYDDKGVAEADENGYPKPSPFSLGIRAALGSDDPEDQNNNEPGSEDDDEWQRGYEYGVSKRHNTTLGVRKLSPNRSRKEKPLDYEKLGAFFNQYAPDRNITKAFNQHEQNQKDKKGVAEGIMDTVKQAFNDNVAAWPMGTSDEQFIKSWADDIRDRTGRDIPAEKLARLYQDYTRRSPDVMQSHGTTNEESGVTEARPDVMRHKGDKTVKVVKRGGVPIGEIGIDSEASPGNGQYYVKLYDGSYDAVGFDTAEEALAELKYAVKQGMAEGVTEAGAENNPVVNAITRRIIMQRTDLLSKYGLEKVSDAIDEVADFVGDVEEIGSSDVSGWVRHVEQMLGNMVDQSLAETTSAGGVATVPGVGGGPKVGSLFGGSYSPKTPFTGKKKAKESVIKR